jgi:chloride channel 3/4/5
MDSRSSSISVLPSPRVFQRASFSSRVSSAIESAEQGVTDAVPNAADREIHEEIDEIKRYEVRLHRMAFLLGAPS